MVKLTLVEQQLDIYWINNKLDVLDKKIDKNGRILILDVKIDETNFVLINIYFPNSKTEQLNTLLNLGKMLVLAGTFNFFFDTFLNSCGGKLTL